MSGSSGGGYAPPQRAKFDCDTGIINSTVSSVDLEVLSNHIVGDILDVIIGNNGALVLEDGNGEILGAILHRNTTDIINCINEGAQYEAEILNINSPSCLVQISRK
ncbi:hypothetical protein KZP23_02645 [Echinicola marina]|uniref:hypothetical protein n=1 Tax=Echinicola marina TaxID=2859768 RepID=UPI001CF6630F|nr:hypothetical protein [Echinicola marina]UCS93952.1 hypothetical protein KZP23_02645 [Echinicola marina]